MGFNALIKVSFVGISLFHSGSSSLYCHHLLTAASPSPSWILRDVSLPTPGSILLWIGQSQQPLKLLRLRAQWKYLAVDGGKLCLKTTQPGLERPGWWGIVRGFPGMVVSSGGIITTSRILGFNQLSSLRLPLWFKPTIKHETEHQRAAFFKCFPPPDLMFKRAKVKGWDHSHNIFLNLWISTNLSLVSFTIHVDPKSQREGN